MNESQTTETNELCEKPKLKNIAMSILIIILIVFSFIAGLTLGPRLTPQYKTR